MTPEHYEHILCTERVLELHAEGIRRYQEGEVASPRPGCVEACLGNAYNAELYQGSASRGFGLIFAAYVLFYLVRDHCFMDGNKRLGFLAAMDVLASLGLTLDCTDDDAYEMVTLVATGEWRSATAVIDWLVPRLCELPASS